MLKYQIEHITFMSKVITELDLEIKETALSEEYIELLDELPGIARRSAEKILTETGTEMKQFRDADHFASWPGLVPQCNESAGKKKSTRLRKGNKYHHFFDLGSDYFVKLDKNELKIEILIY